MTTGDAGERWLPLLPAIISLIVVMRAELLNKASREEQILGTLQLAGMAVSTFCRLASVNGG